MRKLKMLMLDILEVLKTKYPEVVPEFKFDCNHFGVVKIITNLNNTFYIQVDGNQITNICTEYSNNPSLDQPTLNECMEYINNYNIQYKHVYQIIDDVPTYRINNNWCYDIDTLMKKLHNFKMENRSNIMVAGIHIENGRLYLNSIQS